MMGCRCRGAAGGRSPRKAIRSFVAALALVLATAGATSGVTDAPDRERDAAGGLTLEMCLERALARAPSLAASRAAEAAAQAVADEAAARRWPVLGLAGSFRYTSEVMRRRVELGGLGGFDLEFGDGHQADLNLGLSFPLYTGGELGRAARAAAAGARAAGHRREAVRLELTWAVRRAFHGALGREAQLAAAELAVRRLERHRDEVAAAVELGAATEEARLRTLARLREAEQRRLQAAAARDSAGIALGRLLGRPAEPVRPAGDLETSLLASPEPSSEQVAARVAGRPEVTALVEEEVRQRLLAAAARGRFLPGLSGEVRAHHGRPGVDVLENEWMSYLTAGVALDWTLLDGGARDRRAQQSSARAREAAALGQDAREAFTAAHAAARTTLDAAGAELERARERVDLERRILEHVERRRDEAAATESEYLDAQDDLSEAEIALALAVTRVRLAEAALLWTLAR